MTGPRKIVTTAELKALEAHGWTVREVWLGEYYDGLSATKVVCDRPLVIWASGDDNGVWSEIHYPVVVYIGHHALARDLTVDEALRGVDDWARTQGAATTAAEAS